MTTTRKPKLLVLDDDAGTRFAIQRFLETRGYEVTTVESCQSAQDGFESFLPDAAILDYSLPDGNALELIRNVRGRNSMIPIIILTGHGSINLAVEAIKEGAEQFLTKPVDLSTLSLILERTLEDQRNRQKQLAARTLDLSTPDPFIGDSVGIRALRGKCERLAAVNSTVLISGETGTGKGVLARWLHDNSPRADEPFVDVNCAGLPRDLLESELFGHQKGAFTGALIAKPGLFEVAHRGTVFLDELADMSLDLQPKLLKVVEEREFRRLGEVRARKVDVRLIAATHQDLGQLVQAGKFRSDLYFRINAVTVKMPPLRERPEDVPKIASHILNSLAASMGKEEVTLSGEAVEALKRYSWPGNIREVRNVLERALLIRDKGSALGPQHLSFEPASSAAVVPSKDLSMHDVERQHIIRVLEMTYGHVAHAAQILGLSKTTLYAKMRRYKVARSLRIEAN